MQANTSWLRMLTSASRVPHELPQELLTSCLMSCTECGARVPPTLLRVLPTTHKCLMSPSRIVRVLPSPPKHPRVPHKCLTSASQVAHHEATRGRFQARLKSSQVAHRTLHNLPSCPDFLAIYVSYSRVVWVTHELCKFPTRGQLGASVTRP